MLADAHGFARPEKQTLLSNPGGRAPADENTSYQRRCFLIFWVELYGVVVQWLVYIHGMDGIGVRFSATPPRQTSVP